MKVLTLIFTVLCLNLTAQDKPETYTSLGFGAVLTGALVHSSPLFEGSNESINVSNIGTVIAILGVCSFGYGIVLSERFKFEATPDKISIKLKF